MSKFEKLIRWLGIRRTRASKEKPAFEAEEVNEFGQFNNITSVLNTLDAMFKDIKRLTPKKSDVQRIIQRYGPYVCSLSETDSVDPSGESGEVIMSGGFESGFKAYGLPTMLISYLDRSWFKGRDADDMMSDFLMCHRSERIPFFKKKEGYTYYDCTYVFMFSPPDNVGGGRIRPHEVMFFIEVNLDTGAAVSYPYLTEKEVVINGRKVSGKRALYYPDLINQGDGERKKHSQQEIRNHLVSLFYLHYNMVMRREMGINIIVKKGKSRATIVIPPNRWKYFFLGRDHIYNKLGNKKRIFHAVSSHLRERRGKWWQFWLKPKISNVKTHYRGLREFVWNGYKIIIVLPGKHSVSQASYAIDGLHKDDHPDKNLIDPGDRKVADTLNDIFEGRAV